MKSMPAGLITGAGFPFFQDPGHPLTGDGRFKIRKTSPAILRTASLNKAGELVNQAGKTFQGIWKRNHIKGFGLFGHSFPP